MRVTKKGSTAAPKCSGGKMGAPFRRDRGVQEHVRKNSRAHGSQNGVKMDAKSGPGQTVKTELPSRRELT